MKKVLCILLSLFLIICLVGCKTHQINENENIKLNSKYTDIRFWTDEETGVQYVIYNHGAPYKGMGGITRLMLLLMTRQELKHIALSTEFMRK